MANLEESDAWIGRLHAIIFHEEGRRQIRATSFLPYVQGIGEDNHEWQLTEGFQVMRYEVLLLNLDVVQLRVKHVDIVAFTLNDISYVFRG